MHTIADHCADGVSGTAEEGETESEPQEGASSGTDGQSRSNRNSGFAAHAVMHCPIAHTSWALIFGEQCMSQLSHVRAGACRAGSARACENVVRGEEVCRVPDAA